MAPENVYDDAFITYRYAAHWRDGLGLTYNVDEWVLGTTAPLYALLLGLLGKSGVAIVTLGHAVSIIAWAAAAVLAAAILIDPAVGHPVRRFLPCLVAPLIIACHPAIWHSLGMETALLVSLMFLSAVVWLRGHRLAAVVVLSLLILVRADGALWALILGLEVGRRERRLPWPEGIATILLTLPWFLYAQWRYGLFLPNSVVAKVGQNEFMAIAGQDDMFQFFTDFWRALTLDSLLIGVIVTCLLALSLLAVWRRRHYLWLWIWLLANLAIYEFLGVASFPWYFVPAIAVSALLMGLGSGELARLWQWRVARLAVVVPMLLIVGLGLSLTSQARTNPVRHHPAYRSVADWLATETDADATVTSIEIGAIGYFSDRTIVDTMGLVTPALTERQYGWRETLVYTTAVIRPDYAVVLSDTAWDGVIGLPWFDASYVPVANFDDVTIYEYHETTQFDHVIVLDNAMADGLELSELAYGSERLDGRRSLPMLLTVNVTADQSEIDYFDLFLVDAQSYDRYAAASLVPFDGGYAIEFWQPGDRFALPFELPLPDELPDGAYRIGVVLDGLEAIAGWLRHGDMPSLPSDAPPYLSTNVAWQDGPILTGLTALQDAVLPAETASWRLRWYLPEAQARDLKMFFHIVDEAGTIVAQLDQRPVNGRWALPIWQAGETVEEIISLPLSADIAPGVYVLHIGWYDDAGRLSLIDTTADFYRHKGAFVVSGAVEQD